MKRFFGRVVAARSDLFELAGFALVTMAAFLLTPILGFAVAGGCLIIIGRGISA